MSDETTQNISDARSFEERVFARFDVLDSRLDKMDERLTTLEERVERRLQETRPIWEQVLTRLDSLETETRNGFRRLSREMGVIGKDMIELRAAQGDLESRVDKLEERNSPQ
jgi:chromosome segregation ATPase